MIFHELQQMKNVVVCSKDMDVILLMVFAYGLNKIKKKWVSENQVYQY